MDNLVKRKLFPKGSAVIIGGSGGIGSAICKTFASHGVPVIFSYHGNEKSAKDLEQEICIILFLIGLYLMTLKIFQLNSKKYLFNVDFLEDIGSSKVSGEKAIVELEKLPKDISSSPLIETLKASLRRYMITDNVQNTSDAINVSVNNLALKLDSENTMLRYLIWAIPSLGFVGTVRGIGQALSNADKALAGDISGMSQSCLLYTSDAADE